MGQAGSGPVTKKQSGDGAAPAVTVRWGHSCMQGWRDGMEDAHFAIPSLDGVGWEDTAAFGVLDGHGGPQVAQFCRRHLPEEIVKGVASRNARSALVTAFHRMDELLAADAEAAEEDFLNGRGSSSELGVDPHYVGSTATVCLVRRDTMVVANCGDSRVVLCRKGKAIALTEDHKPTAPAEHERILRAGGEVQRQRSGPFLQYRVNGNLNLSRSIGDLEYKKAAHLAPHEQMICSTPDVRCIARDPCFDEFLILACDGVWDVLDNQEVVDFIRIRLPDYRKGLRPLSKPVEELLNRCLSHDLSRTQGLGGDNMTAILVVLNDGPSAAEPSDVLTGEVGVCEQAFKVQESLPYIDSGTILTRGFCSCQLVHQ